MRCNGKIEFCFLGEIYFFSMQISSWKKHTLLNLMAEYLKSSWLMPTFWSVQSESFLPVANLIKQHDILKMFLQIFKRFPFSLILLHLSPHGVGKEQ